MSTLDDIGEASPTPEAMVTQVLADKRLLSEVIKGVSSKKEAIRYDSFKALMILTEENPELVYPEWDYFAGLLSSDNTSHKYIAIYIIANLAKADIENKFENLFNQYYSLLNDRSVVTAAHLAGNSGKIARAKPELQTKITNKLLSIDETHHKPERKDLVKGYAIESFGEYFEEVENKKEIIEFVKRQLKAGSPRTVKKAEEFLKKWER